MFPGSMIPVGPLDISGASAETSGSGESHRPVSSPPASKTDPDAGNAVETGLMSHRGTISTPPHWFLWAFPGQPPVSPRTPPGFARSGPFLGFSQPPLRACPRTPPSCRMGEIWRKVRFHQGLRHPLLSLCRWPHLWFGHLDISDASAVKKSSSVIIAAASVAKVDKFSLGQLYDQN